MKDYDNITNKISLTYHAAKVIEPLSEETEFALQVVFGNAMGEHVETPSGFDILANRRRMARYEIEAGRA